MKFYLYPRTYRRKLVLWYFRVLRGRSRDKTIPFVERELSIAFLHYLKSDKKDMSHFVNGIFAKELVVTEIDHKIKFILVENETKVIFHKYGTTKSVYIEKHVSAKTASHMNKLYDKEFAKLLIVRNEHNNKVIKELFLID